MLQVGQNFVEDIDKELNSADWLISEKTIAQSIHCRDIGIHSGKEVEMRFEPAPAGTGIKFIRDDINDGNNVIDATWDEVEFTTLCTEISNDDNAVVATIEHVMAALAGKGIDNLYIHVNGSELPILDGSSKEFLFLLESAGIQTQSQARKFLKILKPVEVCAKNEANRHACARLFPIDEWCFQLDMRINFPNTVIGEQKFSYRLGDDFSSEIAPARTYGFVNDVATLQSHGLAKGASHQNAIAVNGNQIMNEGGLRFTDEFVRHKLLDAIGDLYLAGKPIIGRFEGDCSGHGLNNQLLHALFSDPSNYTIISADEYKKIVN